MVTDAVIHEDPGALRVLWERLHAGQPEATVFMHPGWCVPWWRHYGEGRRALLIEVAGGLGAFCIGRRGGQRILEAWGTGQADHWDVLAPPGEREQVLDAVARELMRHDGEWDAAFLRCLPPDGSVEAALERAGARISVRRPMVNPLIELPGDWDAYLKSLSPKMRKDVRRPIKLLDQGALEFREITDPAELPAALDQWQRIRRAQWAAQGKEISPEHLTGRFRLFLLDAARELIPTGLGHVWEARHEGEVVGINVGFADAQRYYSYLGGFDPSVMRLGVGRLFVVEGIRSSIEAGRPIFDFGRGGEEYKFRYGAVDRPMGGIVAGSRRPRSRLVVAGARAMASRGGE